MKRRFILSLIILLMFTGCQNQEEEIKNEYIAIKNDVFEEKNYKDEEIPVDVVVTIDRINEEELLYEVDVKNPKEDMYDVKAMVVHNYYNEDTFPSIGVFDESKDLLVDSGEEEKITLKDTLKTAKDIRDLNLELKVWIEYRDKDGNKKDIYYKTT